MVQAIEDRRLNTDPRLHEYYGTKFDESQRLIRREGQLEMARTQELLTRFLPESPVRVIDIGGGTGAYASWLASLGHQVHLVDVVSMHVEESARVGTFTSAVGDARSLPDEDDAYDVALLLGPMYHLLERPDRLQALGEARRVVKPGGLVAIAYISRPAVVLSGYVQGWIYDERGLAGLDHVVRLGSDPGGASFGPIAYFHQPSEVTPEVEAANLDVLGVFGVEGPGWIAADFDGRWQHPDGRELMLESARTCESEPEEQGLSPHLLAIARKP